MQYPKSIDANSKAEKFAYHEFIYNVGAGLTGQVRALAGEMITISTLLAVLKLGRYWWLIPVLAITYLIGNYIIGLVLLKKNIVNRRGSVTNKLSNPELMKILKKDGTS